MHVGKSIDPALTRRGLLGATAAACSAAVLGAGPAWAAPASGLSARQRSAILAVSGALAVFPVAFPAWRGVGPAGVREMPSRLLAVAGRLDGSRLSVVATGADALAAAGLTGTDRAGAVAVLSARADDSAVTAVAAAAAATLSDRYDPGADGFAANWLGILARMRDAGTLTPTLSRRAVA